MGLATIPVQSEPFSFPSLRKEAISAYDEAANMAGPQKGQAFLSKARCTATLGQFSEAVKLYREYLISYPGTARAVEISLRIQAFEQKMKGASEG